MTPARRRGACVVLACTLASCWSQPLSRADHGARPPDRPPPRENPAGPERIGPLPDGGKRAPELAPLDSSDLRLVVLPGPVAINLRKNAPRGAFVADRATVRIDLPVGFTHGLPGLAELLADAVAETADGAGNRPALRHVVTGLGGSLEVGVGAAWTRFSIAVPVDRWQVALRELAQRLARVPVDRAALEALQDTAIRRQLLDWERAPLLSQVAQWLRHGDRARQDIVAAIESRSLPELLLFQQRYYQPRGVGIGLWIPGREFGTDAQVEAVLGELKTALQGWNPGPIPPEAAARQETTAPNGVQWIEDAPARKTARVALLAPIHPSTPEWLTLLETFSMGGIGGRLGAEVAQQLRREVVFVRHVLGSYDHRYAVFEAEVADGEVVTLWSAARKAWSSLQAAPPTGPELRDAVERARLLLLRRQVDADEWFEAVGLRLLREQQGGPRTDLAVLAGIDGPAVAAAAGQLATRGLAMVVLGGPVPARTAPGLQPEDVQRVVPGLPEYRTAPTESVADAEAQAEAFLRQAVSALGDRIALLASQGYRSKESWTDGAGLAVLVQNVYQHQGTLKRTTKVLATAIETAIGDGKGTESAAGTTRNLTAGEVTDLLDEAARHPVALLARVVKGELKFRYLGVRAREDRRVALLERVDDTQPRLRLSIEVGSGLVRTVESTVHRPGIGPVQIHDSYDDYRLSGLVRVPMHRVTRVAGSAGEVDCTYESFVLLQR